MLPSLALALVLESIGYSSYEVTETLGSVVCSPTAAGFLFFSFTFRVLLSCLFFFLESVCLSQLFVFA